MRWHFFRKIDIVFWSLTSQAKANSLHSTSGLKSIEEREMLVRQFEAVSKRLEHHEDHQLDNHGLMCAMFDVVEGTTPQESFPGDERVETKSLLSNIGKMDYI